MLSLFSSQHIFNFNLEFLYKYFCTSSFFKKKIICLGTIHVLDCLFLAKASFCFDFCVKLLVRTILKSVFIYFES
jgi:hypothetical protein